MREDLLTKVWAAATNVIFDELSSGRGVSVPELGAFTVECTDRHTTVLRQPALTLSATFARVGVKPPAARCRGVAHMIGWVKIAQVCEIDRDLARRALAACVARFTTQLGESPSRATLDLGRCGKVHLLRCSGGGFEARVEFASALCRAVRGSRGAAAPTASSIGQYQQPPSCQLRAVGTAAPSEPQDTATAGANESSDRVVSLEQLSHLMNAYPSQPLKGGHGQANGSLQGSSERGRPHKASALEPPPILPPPPRTCALPQVSPEIDEWAVTKQLRWNCDANLESERFLSTAGRQRRVELDHANKQVAKQRRAQQHSSHGQELPKVGVLKLLQRLSCDSSPSATGSEVHRPNLTGGASSGNRDDTVPMSHAGYKEVMDEAEESFLLARKCELQQRLLALEAAMDTASNASFDSSRHHRAARAA
jgi:hypothetical protein